MKWAEVPEGKSKVQSAKSKVRSKKSNDKSTKPEALSKNSKISRKLKQSNYKSFRLHKRIHQPKPPIIGSFRLLVRSIKVLWRNKRLFVGITSVYLVLTIILVKGFGVSSGIVDVKDTLVDLFQEDASQFSTSLTLFSVLLSNASSVASEVAGAYQSMLLIVTSLVLIWALRHTMLTTNTKISIRDAFYKSLYPLVPFLLILMLIGLQLIPLLISNFLYSVVIAGGLAVTTIEQALWIILIAGMALLSLYMITSSIFALYIVTLPDVRPMNALKSARELVRHRRWTVMRKVIFLPIALLILAGVIMVPLIIIAAAVAEWVFFILSMLSLALVHSYMYGLYRELIKND